MGKYSDRDVFKTAPDLGLAVSLCLSCGTEMGVLRPIGAPERKPDLRAFRSADGVTVEPLTADGRAFLDLLAA